MNIFFLTVFLKKTGRLVHIVAMCSACIWSSRVFTDMYTKAATAPCSTKPPSSGHIHICSSKTGCNITLLYHCLPQCAVVIYMKWGSFFLGGGTFQLILGAFARLRRATIIFAMFVCLSVRPSVWNNSTPNGQIFTKFDTWVFFENL
jgi:hypothetical protein